MRRNWSKVPTFVIKRRREETRVLISRWLPLFLSLSILLIQSFHSFSLSSSSSLRKNRGGSEHHEVWFFLLWTVGSGKNVLLHLPPSCSFLLRQLCVSMSWWWWPSWGLRQPDPGLLCISLFSLQSWLSHGSCLHVLCDHLKTRTSLEVTFLRSLNANILDSINSSSTKSCPSWH